VFTSVLLKGIGPFHLDNAAPEREAGQRSDESLADSRDRPVKRLAGRAMRKPKPVGRLAVRFAENDDAQNQLGVRPADRREPLS